MHSFQFYKEKKKTNKYARASNLSIHNKFIHWRIWEVNSNALNGFKRHRNVSNVDIDTHEYYRLFFFCSVSLSAFKKTNFFFLVLFTMFYYLKKINKYHIFFFFLFVTAAATTAGVITCLHKNIWSYCTRESQFVMFVTYAY